MIEIQQATQDHIAQMQTRFTLMGWQKSDGYFQRVYEQQLRDEVVLLIALHDGDYIGHCKIIWHSDYPYFAEHHIPEIQDLAILPDFRRQGIATRLITQAEAHIKQHTSHAGIGFGLYADYGNAQRLYVKLGYIPDGQGVIAGDTYPNAGDMVRLDDALVLYLVKQL